MQDTIEVTLPLSGKKAIIRNYTTHADDSLATAVLTANAYRADNGTVKYPAANFINFNEAYMKALVRSLDGNSQDIEQQLNQLRSKDYDVLRDAVTKIVEDSSPKALTDKETAKTATNTK